MNPELDGAEYLRRLKGSPDAPEGPTRPTHDQALESSPSASPSERRAVPRFDCKGSVLVRAENSDARVLGSVKDISLHGCYLEMTSTFPVSTIVLLQIELAGHQVNLKGEIRAAYPHLGMGVAFRDVPDDVRKQLSEIVRKVMREMRVLTPASEPSPASWRMPEVTDPKRALEMIGALLRTRTHVSRDEFLRILQSVSPN